MAGASCRQPLQPLGAMVRRVDPPTDTENRPAAVQSFESIHDPGEIFGGRQITAGQLLQGSQARFRLSLVDRREKAAAQQLGQLPRSEEHTSELQSLAYLVCRLLLEKKKKKE